MSGRSASRAAHALADRLSTGARRYGRVMAVDLFAGIPVGDYERALDWYARLLGSAPSFVPNATEAVWELAEHRWMFIEVRPDHAGHAMHTIFVDDLDARVEEIAGRGIESAERETYSNGVRKVTYRDLDGNEIGFGGAPLTR
jgi:catechol 2,3-dioxygenase-like lactoylglutathione lyase family enzyme